MTRQASDPAGNSGVFSSPLARRSALSMAVKDLRSSLNENQQKFSNRLNVALATVARWEIGDRRPGLVYLNILWRLAKQQDRADLAGVFAEALTGRCQLGCLPGDAEIERLREALDRILFFTTGVPHDALGWAVNRAQEIARQALEEPCAGRG